MATDTKILEKKINKEYKTGNVKSAIELCQIGLQDDPTNADLHLRLGDLYLAWHLDIYNSSQYIDEAITEYQRALESYIDSAEIYYKIGRAHFYKGDLDKAINYLDMAISKNEKFAKAYYLLAETYTKKARFLEAAINARKAVKYKPFSNSCAHYLLSNLYKLSSFRAFKNSVKSWFEFVLSLLTLPFDFDDHISTYKIQKMLPIEGETPKKRIYKIDVNQNFEIKRENNMAKNADVIEKIHKLEPLYCNEYKNMCNEILKMYYE